MSTTHEITGKFKYTGGNTGSKSFTGISSEVAKANLTNYFKKYAKAVDGILQDTGTFKVAEDIVFNG